MEKDGSTSNSSGLKPVRDRSCCGLSLRTFITNHPLVSYSSFFTVNSIEFSCPIVNKNGETYWGVTINFLRNNLNLLFRIDSGNNNIKSAFCPLYCFNTTPLSYMFGKTEGFYRKTFRHQYPLVLLLFDIRNIDLSKRLER